MKATYSRFALWGLVAVLGTATSIDAREIDDVPPATSYALTAWAAEKGLPPGDVFAITQDTEGYLWLGTPTGLFRFDGLRFTAWQADDPAAALPSAPVHALIGSPDGSVWVGFGGGGGVVRIHRDRVVRYSAADGAPPGVTAMMQDRGGAIWVATRRGVFRHADGRWMHLGPEEGLDRVETFSLHEDRAGQLWVATGRGVYRRTGRTFTLIDPASNNVQSIASDHAGGIWITDPNRLVTRFGGATPDASPDIRLPAGAWRVMVDSRGHLWVAAFSGGLLRIADPGQPAARLERFAFEHRLAGSPRALYEDRDGNIWVGMRGGLLRLSETSFTTVTALEGLGNEGVRTTAVDREGSVWVATGHGLNRFSSAGRAAYVVPRTMSLHTDRHGDLWVAGSREIGRWRKDGIERVPIPEIVATSQLMAITTDAQDRLWLCTSLKGVMMLRDGAVMSFENTPIAGRPCQSISTDSRGRVWIGFLTGGAAVYDNGTFQIFSVGEGLAAGTVLSILEDRSGAIWLGTSSGLARHQNGRFTSITQANAPLADLVPVLVEDLDGYIWVGVSSGAGIMRIHPSEADKVAANPMHHIQYAYYDESDGMQQGSQTWQSGVGGVRGGDGRLWVATGVGLTVIDPARLPAPRPLVPPRIEDVTADGRRISPLRDLAMPAGTSTLRIQYGTVSLSSATKVHFRYMLEGLDEDWVYAGKAREVTYSNVGPGDYRFRVSTTHDGRWTEATVWSFSVAPPLYRTRSFLVLVAAALTAMLGIAWWMRMRALRHQYALVFAERARVSREIHDTLLQSLAAIGVELETIATQLDPAHDPTRGALRRLRKQVGHCLREARESILELRRNTAMKPQALVDSLRELADATTAIKRVATHFTWSGRVRSIADDGDIQLLRIAQEAVNNAITHGRATTIRIELTYDGDVTVLTIADNGCGFTPDDQDAAAARGEHLGLLNMRERAARLRGRVVIHSRPGHGTTVEATIPAGG